MVRNFNLPRFGSEKYEFKKYNTSIVRVLLAASTVLFLSSCEQVSVPSQNLTVGSPTKFISYLKPGEQANGVLVKFSSNVGNNSRARSIENAGLTAQEGNFNLVPGLSLTQAKPGLTINETLEALSNDPNVAYAEPDYIYTISVLPNDSMFSQQWGLNNNGNNDIDAPEAWDITTGSNQVIIAVIDSGVDYTHPDLQANIWTNPGEIAGNNRDDDNNGFIDDVRGWDFGSNDNDPMDENDHGTHVAGVIGASGNNNRGVTGINWNVQIMPLKFMNAAGQGSTSAAINSLQYAVDNGARVSNNSWGGGAFSQSLFDAIQNANRQNHLFVAASGNDGVNTDGGNNYPSTYNLPNIISVAASNQNDALTNFSNFGSTTVDLAAPGQAILSTVRAGSYQSMQGTSMAAPFVSGVAGLVLSQNTGLTVAQVKAAILDNVDPIGALSNRVLTGGRLNALNAVSGVGSAPAPIQNVEITAPQSAQIPVGDTMVLNATGGDGNFTWNSSNTNVATISRTGVLTAQQAGTTQITATDGAGIVSGALSITITRPANATLVITPNQTNPIALNETLSLSVSGGTAPYTWQSSNTTIATISTGTLSTQLASVSPNRVGSFRVIVTDANNNQTQSNIITIASSPVTIGTNQTSLGIAETLQLSVSGGTSPYTWRSTSPFIISVSQGGLVEGLAEGTSEIIVTDNNRASTSVIMQVTNVVAGTLTLTPGTNVSDVNLRVVIKATGGTSSINWRSLNPNIATVNSRGIVSTVAVGTTEIQATDSAGNSGSIPFEVRSVDINSSVITIGAGDTLQLSAVGGVEPYTWKSANSAIATVDAQGLLRSNAGAFGGVLITAADADNIKKNIIITVNDATNLRAPKAQ